ncbi:MAG: hypothetical protein ACLR4A_01400 [Christensenellales bacterium]
MTKRIWAGLLALGMALTALPSGMYAEETVWEEETDASEETLDGGLDESAEEFADGLPDYIPEPEEDVVDSAADDESADALPEQEESLTKEAMLDLPDFIPEEEPLTLRRANCRLCRRATLFGLRRIRASIWISTKRRAMRTTASCTTAIS